jgi:hypothetical protein
MDYQVKLVKGEDESISVDTVYAVDYSNKCRQMHDADGDSIPDACWQKTSTMCGEESGFEKVECVDKHKTLLKIARDNFKKYFPPLRKADEKKTKKDESITWELGQTRRIMGITSAIYSCGEYCSAEFIDYTSDGFVDETLLGINAFSMRFYGIFPDSAHVKLQQGIVSALEKFLPWEFSSNAFKSTVESTEKPARFRFAHALSFAYDGEKGSNDFMMYDGVKLAFVKEEKVGEVLPEETKDAVVSTSAAVSGKQKILIGYANGQMVDVTEDYFEYGPDDLGVVPLTSTEDDESE